jgi:hypothetical protein
MNRAALETVDVAEDFDDDGGYCWKCDGQGFIIVCCDDLCHGQGFCMHGDGEVICPVCEGESAW